MILDKKKVVNNKVIELIEIYNFCFIHFSIELCLNNLNFEFKFMRTLNRISR
jgi:hypothetical protein